MDYNNLLESLFRWIHVVAGILWIGLLYFFNWVNSAFAPTMDGDTKKKVVPELLPRTLYWFRWGAAYTWITGAVLMTLVYYQTSTLWESGEANWGPAAYVAIALTFLSVFIYDALYKTALKNANVGFWVSWILASGAIYLFDRWAGFSFRGYAIHLGALFGTNMAFNVWYRIWPAQQKIITAIKNGEAPDGALVALAGQRSKHNTYMSVPLVFTMLAQHMTWSASATWYLTLVVLVGWLIVNRLYEKAKTVPGF